MSVDWIHWTQDLLNAGFVKFSQSQLLTGRRATNLPHPKKYSSTENLIISLREAIEDKLLKGVTDRNLQIMMSRLICRSVPSR